MQSNNDKLLELYKPQSLKTITTAQQLHAGRFSPCGKFFVAGGMEGDVRRWRLADEEPQELDRLDGHDGWVQGLTFDQKGELLFTADSWGQLRAWENWKDTPKVKWQVKDAHNGWIRELAVNPNGKLIASCGLDQRVCLWSTDTGTKQAELANYGQDIFSVLFHGDGKSFVSGDGHGIVKQWDVDKRECVREFDASALYLYHRIQNVGGVRTLAFDREGKTLAVGGTKPKNGGNVQGVPTVLLFDWASGKLKHTLEFGATTHCYVHDVHLHDAGFVIAVTSGTPGTGQLIFQQPDAKEAFYLDTKLTNLHSLSVHEASRRIAVTGTNRGSNGNGRRLNKEGEYIGNNSPIYVFHLGPSE